MTEINSIVDLIKYPTTLGIPYGEFILISTFLISFLSLKKYKTEIAFSAAIFITTVTATFLTFLGLLSAGILPALVLITALSIAILYLAGRIF
jgi:uncharacterized membrane protein